MSVFGRHRGHSRRTRWTFRTWSSSTALVRREPSRHNRDLDQLPPMPPKHFLTSNFRVAFEEYFQPQQQRDAIDTLQGHIAEVRNGTEEQRRELGVLRPQDTTAAQVEDRTAAYLDKCYWQLAQFYRVRILCFISLVLFTISCICSGTRAV